jgi:NADH:ubiquinone oxidoreductase subunit F (NADH-binding)
VYDLDDRAPHVLAARDLPRLLPSEDVRTLDAHRARFGARPRGTTALIAEVERAGLRGHGGAGFSTATKLNAVASRRRRGFVVVNATEGEPMSSKDKALCSVAPHLVLDGAALAAEVVGAKEILVCVDRVATTTSRILRQAIDARAALGADGVVVRLEHAPDRYVSGEESALVRWLDGGDAKPSFVPPRPFERGVGGRPTLVQNAETLAHLALIARYGAGWFRGLGTEADPGSALVTISGAVSRAGVYEIPLGIPLSSMITEAGGSLDDARAVLIGGYFGTWVTSADARRLTVDPSSLRAVGASLGCGVFVVLATDACGLAESAAVAMWMAGENAGQCGPCVNGLPAIAQGMRTLVAGDPGGRTEPQVRRWIEMVKGRGLCKHPDGAARFVASSLDTFGDEIERHRTRGPCAATHSPRVLATPRPGAWR